jgi:hypothetical protein
VPAEVGAHYNAPDAELDPEVVAAIRAWLIDHASDAG